MTYPITPISIETIENATQKAHDNDGMNISEIIIMTTAATDIVCIDISLTKTN